jgi:hypothetical protein
MVKAWQVATAVVIAGAAGATYWYLTRGPPTPPPGKYNLSLSAKADGTDVAIDLSVDSQVLTTPGYLVLDAGSYTISAPDQISVSGVVYYFDRYEEV